MPQGAVHPSSQIIHAAARIQQDQLLRRRLITAAALGRAEFETSPYVEEQIYASFIPNGDKSRMNAFHSAPWQDRVSIVAALEDARLRYHGYRLIYERHPELLDERLRDFFYQHDRTKLLDTSDKLKWNSLPMAYAAIDAVRAGCTDQQSSIVDEYRHYLERRIAAEG
ncbi:hypothetical protein NKH61_34015 [Mesorhizobium sp. M1005]|uniref:hypothetical protein n=1 Tax=unclassified Mesorhizobium TaxID=325217 RepID=UPI003339E78F